MSYIMNHASINLRRLEENRHKKLSEFTRMSNIRESSERERKWFSYPKREPKWCLKLRFNYIYWHRRHGLARIFCRH